MIAQRPDRPARRVYADTRATRQDGNAAAQNTGVERRVRQRANAEDKIGRIPVRVDKVIGQRQLNV
jgi:hypothetical protein